MWKFMNKWKPLNRHDRKKIMDLQDPLTELILINGWRRSEVAQSLMFYNGGNYAYFRPKKKKEIKAHLLTKREKELLNELKNGDFKNTKNTLTAFNKKINRHFNKIAEKLGFNEFFPHRLRATFGTNLSRMGVPIMTIKEAMNHNKMQTTEGYIQPEQEDIVEAKELNSELLTVDGMTIHEWRAFALDKIKQIKRLEERLNHEKN